jgi:integrase
MALNLYRRHRPNCEGGRPYDSRSGDFDERKKTWRKCACPIFASGSLGRRFRRHLTDIWRNRRLAKIFELAGPFEEKPTPHRFRHKFVRILLEKGVPVADVAELIGDTEDVLRRHYSRWIKTRKSSDESRR